MTTQIADQIDQPTPAAERAAAEDARRAERDARRRYSFRSREDAAARERGDFVGFVGCARRGRLLRVRVGAASRQTMRVMCPHCEEEHVSLNAMPRPRRAAEPEPELVEIAPVEDKPDPNDPTALHGTQRVTDAAIFDALSADRDALVNDVARDLGYAGTSCGDSLMLRLRRMNARAEKVGDPPPFAVTKGTGGRPARARLTAEQEAPAP